MKSLKDRFNVPENIINNIHYKEGAIDSVFDVETELENILYFETAEVIKIDLCGDFFYFVDIYET